MVEEEVTVGDLVRLLPLERGGISIVELTIPADSPSAGRPLYEMRLPPDATIVAIIREGHVVIPQPETVISDGDEVLALTVPDAESALRSAVLGEGEGP
jgi:trk system potassium uptake protein TrkA